MQDLQLQPAVQTTGFDALPPQQAEQEQEQHATQFSAQGTLPEVAPEEGHEHELGEPSVEGGEHAEVAREATASEQAFGDAQPCEQQALWPLGNPEWLGSFGARAIRGPARRQQRSATASQRAYQRTPLTPAQRAELVRLTTSKIELAFAAFGSAANTVRLELYAAAQQERQIISFFAQTVMGMALPAIGPVLRAAFPAVIRSLSSAMTANVPANVASLLREVGPGVASDLVKRVGTSVMGAVAGEVVQSAQAQDASSFVSQLERSMQGACQLLIGRLPSASDEELVSMYAAFDYRVANNITFAEALRERCRALQAIQAIGRVAGWPTEFSSSYSDLIYVGDPARGNRNPLHGVTVTAIPHGARYATGQRIPDDMRQMALDAYASRHGGGRPRTLHNGQAH